MAGDPSPSTAEKLWRDAQPRQLADGTTDGVSLQAAARLVAGPSRTG